MQPQLPDSAVPNTGAPSFRFWEHRRLFYNLLLLAVVVSWVVASWPHFRPAFALSTFLTMSVLALLANLCYSLVYLLEWPLSYSPFRAHWVRWRWVVWILGTALAIVLANYWIADEIYPFVR